MAHGDPFKDLEMALDEVDEVDLDVDGEEMDDDMSLMDMFPEPDDDMGL